jgi:hypothetical protein
MNSVHFGNSVYIPHEKLPAADKILTKALSEAPKKPDTFVRSDKEKYIPRLDDDTSDFYVNYFKQRFNDFKSYSGKKISDLSSLNFSSSKFKTYLLKILTDGKLAYSVTNTPGKVGVYFPYLQMPDLKGNVWLFLGDAGIVTKAIINELSKDEIFDNDVNANDLNILFNEVAGSKNVEFFREDPDDEAEQNQPVPEGESVFAH